MTRAFDAPAPDWHRGHRGVDLAGTAGQPVYAAGDATVVYAGTLAGRPVLSLAHIGGLHTSYEPVRAAVRVGQRVAAGVVIGELLAGHSGCPAAACLHWGAMWGSASHAADYVDPLGLLAVDADPPQAVAAIASGAGVGLVVHRTQPCDGDVRVELRGGQAGVAQQLLHDAQVGAAFEQMRCGAVA